MDNGLKEGVIGGSGIDGADLVHGVISGVSAAYTAKAEGMWVGRGMQRTSDPRLLPPALRKALQFTSKRSIHKSIKAVGNTGKGRMINSAANGALATVATIAAANLLGWPGSLHNCFALLGRRETALEYFSGQLPIIYLDHDTPSAAWRAA